MKTARGCRAVSINCLRAGSGAGDRRAGFAAVALRRGDDVAGDEALVDDLRIGAADLAADTGVGARAVGAADDRVFGRAARRFAAEERAQRLFGGGFVAGARRAGGGRGQREIGRTSGACRDTAISSGRWRLNRLFDPQADSVIATIEAARMALVRFTSNRLPMRPVYSFAA